jgi:DNA polymerase III epsilon subunit-like protein
MLDLETMGTNSQALICQIGAVYFDKKGPSENEDDQFNVVIDFQSCIDAGLKIDGGTLEWWLRQNNAARSSICDATHSLKDALTEFSMFFKNGTRIWGNGADFDVALLKNAYDAVGLQIPWKYSNVMCFRTLKNLRQGIEKPLTEGTVHNALYDAKWQSKYYSNIINNKKEK